MNTKIVLLGSTYRKLAIFDSSGTLVSLSRAKSSELDLINILDNMFNDDKALIVSVRSDLTKKLKQKKCLYYFDNETCEKLFSIKNTYKRIGSDRLAGLVGAISLCPKKSVLVIDLGTYITLTALVYKPDSEDYELCDSTIHPGISLNLKNGSDNNLLFSSELEDEKPSEMGFISFVKSKKSNMRSDFSTLRSFYEGIFLSVFSFIKESLFRNPDSQVFLTGGWCDLFDSLSNEFPNLIIDKNLTLSGAYFYLEKFYSINRVDK